MTAASTTLALNELLRHENFVRATLRALLRDESSVDDAVQETWLRAAKRPPSLRTDPKAWLARVARNVAISSWRSERRRARREAEVEVAVTTEGAADRSRERVEMRQRVVSAVLELKEPYRSVVLLRYEEGLSTSEVARRLDRSPATVRSQLSRAHETLRGRLDHEFGGRAQWAVLAAPLVRSAKGAILLPAIGLGVVATMAWPLLPKHADSPAPVTAPGVAIAMVATENSSDAPAEIDDVPEREAVAVASVPITGLSQDPKRNERLLARANLLDRSHYGDYESATFSFEHGVRDDPDRKITRNDWEIQLSQNEFTVSMVTDDHSVIADLGPITPRQFGNLSRYPAEFHQQLPVVPGHAYYIGTRDSETDLATVIFVTSHERGRACEFDWYTTDGTGRAQGSLRDAGVGRRWIQVLTKIRALTRREGVLRTPRVLLEVRAGAGGGNPNRMNMAGEASAYVDEVAKSRIDITPPISPKERSVAYSEGGWIPEDHVFVVTSVRYEGSAVGDGNGHGRFVVKVGGKEIVSHENVADPIVGQWTEPIELVSGDETETYLMVANSSAGRVVLDGRLEPRPTRVGFNAPNTGFFSDAERPVAKPEPVMASPDVILQMRTGHNGGNSARLDMRGRKGNRVDEMRDQPLDFEERGPQIGRQAVAYCRGGRVGEGRVFVVTKVVYRGDGIGKERTRHFELVVGGEKIVSLKNPSKPIEGVWTGRIEIAHGEEMRTYLALSNSTSLLLSGDVRISGHFEQRR